jgi:hypothetical protein
MRKPIYKFIILLAVSLQVVSCGLLDWDLDSDGSIIVSSMRIKYDTVYVMIGDTVPLQMSFQPDTVNLKDIFIWSTNSNIVWVDSVRNRLEAVGKGWAMVYVESVSARLKDSCAVYVMPRWEVREEGYPYETVFYANVTKDGYPVGSNLSVAAFVGDECRGVAMPQSFHGVSLTLFRVGADQLSDDVNPDLPPDDDGDEEEPGDNEYVSEDDDEGSEEDDGTGELLREQIEFRCYDRSNYQMYTCPVRVPFDGETHGYLSNLYEIKF